MPVYEMMLGRLREVAPALAADVEEAAKHYALEVTQTFVAMLDNVMRRVEPAAANEFNPGPVIEMWRERYYNESLAAYLTGAIETLKKLKGSFAPEAWHD